MPTWTVSIDGTEYTVTSDHELSNEQVKLEALKQHRDSYKGSDPITRLGREYAYDNAKSKVQQLAEYRTFMKGGLGIVFIMFVLAGVWALCRRPFGPKGPIGVGGFLLFVCISQSIVIPFISILELVGIGQADGQGPYNLVTFLEILLLGTFSCIVGVRLWCVSNNALVWLRRYMVTGLVCAGFTAALALTWPPQGELSPDTAVTIGGFLGGVIGWCIQWFYFKKSRRVANTYGPWEEAAYKGPSLWQWFLEADGSLPVTGKESGSPPENSKLTKDVDSIGEGGKSLTEIEAYSIVAKELECSERSEGLWLKCLCEADGDDRKAKITYAKQRVAKILAERTNLNVHKSSAENHNPTQSPNVDLNSGEVA